MATESDRNLLFGILALQKRLVPQDRLVAALNQWVRDPQKSLGAILREEGVLGEEDEILLETAVHEHLDQRNRFEETVTTLRAQGLVSPRLAEDLDRQCESSWRSLLASTVATERLGDGDRLGRPTCDKGRFRVLRPHARGGLGEVFVARDEELGRDVALKEIQAERAHHPELRARFVLEAEITGGLEHPGIVPVYGLGYHADGRPFYAMRFIRGESLGEAAARIHGQPGSWRGGAKTLLLRQLLGRFVAVCNALAYAHSRGVIHRDVKPQNILLGPYGETLLVDWGLAKLVGGTAGEADGREDCRREHSVAEGLLRPAASGASQTMHGAVVGTPVYMSPEQAAGLIDQLGPASDIYSLGATLYTVLTGHLPFQPGDPTQICNQVILGKFARPRTASPDVPAALEAVCLKAMSLDPARRYASARELADDIEAWLADEPVRAWREPFRVRAGRYARRHRPLVASVAAALLAALVCLSVGIVLVTAAHDRERQAKILAENREQEALKDYRLALGVARRFFTKVADDPRLQEHDLEGLRKELLAESCRDYYAILARQRPEETIGLAMWASETVSLGELIGRTGSYGQAIELLEKARELWDEVVRKGPGDREYALLRATAAGSLAEAYEAVGRNQESRQSLETARRSVEELIAGNPDWPEPRVELANLLSIVGRLEFSGGRFAAAETAYQTVLAVYGELIAKRPDEPGYRNQRAQAFKNLSVVYNKGNRREEALATVKSAREIQQQVVNKWPANPDYQQCLAQIDVALGNIYSALPNRFADAVDAFKACIARRKQLAAAHPKVTQYQIELAVAHNNLGGLLNGKGRVQEARIEYEAARAIYQRVVEQRPEVPQYGRALAVTITGLAGLYGEMGRAKEAEEGFHAAMEIWRKLAAGHGDVREYQADLCFIHRTLGDFLLAQRRFGDAHAALLEALKICEAVAARFQTPVDRLNVARTRLLLGRTACRLERPQEALDWFAQGFSAFQAAPAVFREASDTRLELWQARRSHAEMLSKLGRHKESLAAWNQLVESSGVDTVHVARLGRAEALARAGDHAKAAAEAKDLLDKAKGVGPILYCLAAINARAASGVEKDASLSPAERTRLGSEYATAAVDVLRLAHAAGYFANPARLMELKKDPDFEPLRAREDFRKFLDAAERGRNL